MLSQKKLLPFIFLLFLNVSPVLALTNTNSDYLAQNPEITVEKNPQFQDETNEPLSLQELNKANKALKNNVSVLIEQVNKLSQELNELRSEEQKGNPLAKTGGMFAVIFGSIIFMSILLAFLFYLKLKSDNKREIKVKISDLVQNTKKEIEDSYKNQEDELDETLSAYANSKIQETETKISEKHQLFSQKIEKEFSSFSNQIDTKIKKANSDQDNQLEKITSLKINDFETKIVESSELYFSELEEELTKKFFAKKAEIFEKVEEILPSASLGKLINGLAEEKGLLEEIKAELKTKANDLLIKETEVIYQEMEKKFAADIERLHLANAHFNMGNVLLKNQSYPEATLEFREAVKIKPDFYGAYINLGMTLEKQEENEQAEKVYQEAISLRPDYFKAYFNLGNLLKKLEKYSEATENYKRVIEIRPNFARAFNNLGIVQQLNGEIEAAKNSYREAIKIDNNYVDAYFNLIFSEPEADREKIAEEILEENNAETETREKLKELIKQK